MDFQKAFLCSLHMKIVLHLNCKSVKEQLESMTRTQTYRTQIRFILYFIFILALNFNDTSAPLQPILLIFSLCFFFVLRSAFPFCVERDFFY